jgi:DNA-binding transcriptional LysR family regulator
MVSVTLEQLRIFVAVAEREHVTAAARALNLTQSAVSNALAALEERHAVSLFDRVGRGVALNETGRLFLPEARSVLLQARRAEEALADLAGLRRGRLSIQASQTVAGYWLPERLARFHAAHPGIELAVRAGNSHDAAAAVLGGEAELGFVEGVVDHPMLDRREVGEDRLLVLVRPSHPWAKRKRLGADELARESWVLREAGSGTRSSFEAGLRAMGGDPDALPVSLVLPSNEAVLRAAEAGAGAAALSEHVAALALAAGRLARAPFDLPVRRLGLLRHRDRPLSRAADAFASLCC